MALRGYRNHELAAVVGRYSHCVRQLERIGVIPRDPDDVSARVQRLAARLCEEDGAQPANPAAVRPQFPGHVLELRRDLLGRHPR